MNFQETMGCIAGVLQFVVAGYALRLNRIFGTARVGWSLFWAFLLLALLHVVQFFAPYHAVTKAGIEINVVYTLISALLLTGMVHLETMFNERMRVEREEQRMRAELESEVKKKTAYLTRVLVELQTEIAERKRMESVIETTHFELCAVSRQARLVQMAASVMERVREMLSSVNISTSLISDHARQSKIANVVRFGSLIPDHAADLGKFMRDDPRGRKLPEYIEQLAEHLAAEQTNLLNELDSLKTNLDKIMAIQRDYAKLVGVMELPGDTVLGQDATTRSDEGSSVNANRTAKQDTPDLGFQL
jgi:hypothetical protein